MTAQEKCQKCNGKQHTEKWENPDGSFTFAVCPCTGITAESFEQLCEAIEENGGEASVSI